MQDGRLLAENPVKMAGRIVSNMFLDASVNPDQLISCPRCATGKYLEQIRLSFSTHTYLQISALVPDT